AIGLISWSTRNRSYWNSTAATVVTVDGGNGDRTRGRAQRLSGGGEGVGPRPGGPARDLPQHDHDARRRGARPHPLPPGQDPRLVLHRPRQRGRIGRRRDG